MSKEMYDFKGILNLMIIQIRTGSDQNTQNLAGSGSATLRIGEIAISNKICNSI